MPSSVLLAILVGAGVLALMPALVRRYDMAVRGQAELRSSSMRVLLRRRRRRTVPGAAPINPPSSMTGGRIMGRATVPDSLTPGDEESDALVRAALVRDALERDARSRAARRSATEHTQQLETLTGPARESAAAVRPAVSAQPGGGTQRSMVDTAQLAQWRRFRRRRILLAFSLLLVGQSVGALVVSPGFWVGAAVAGVLTLLYLVKLRVAAASERRQLVAERARQHRAYEFVRVATQHTRVDHGAVARSAAWLATPREARRRPTREIVRVLATAGRSVARGEDGTWSVYKAVETVRPVARPATRRTASAAGRPASSGRPAAVAGDADESLPRAVNV